MRQVARRLRDGRLELVDVPDPPVGAGRVAVRVETSIVSSGTERATLEVARSSLLAKARARPDQARQVVDRARKEGVRATWELVRRRLDELGPLGYSAAGTAIEVGADVRGIAPGDRVAIAGGGFANHAELDIVPELLCAPVPDGVEMEDAAFATIGAIAINGFRRAEAGVGSTVAVIGLGLIGQLTARIARAAGCGVVGVDLEPSLCELASRAGVDAVTRESLDQDARGAGGADAVIVCASGSSSDPIETAARLARDRATVVIVGDVVLDVPRGPFYEKELDLRLARSYGPGRYDPEYELHGHDYPIGHVRWTARRNMEAFLALVRNEALSPRELVTHRYEFHDAEAAFETLTEERPVAIALDYESAKERPTEAAPEPRSVIRRTGRPRLGVVGAGSFATGTMIPGLIEAGFEPVIVASAGGLSAVDAQRTFGFAEAAADIEGALAAGDLQLVAIATGHDTHAALAARALEAGIATYVEKPLALDWRELELVRAAQASSGAPLVVGFNRRHSPAAEALRQFPRSPRIMSYRVNAGPLPATHWTNDLLRGGGRLKGEGCHFIDFVCDQAGGDPQRVLASGFGSDGNLPRAAADNFVVHIEFSDRSVATVRYAADAPGKPGKERFEMSAPGLYAVMEEFSRLSVWRGGRRSRSAFRPVDKGFGAQYAALAAIARGEAEAPAPDSFYVSTLATLAAARSLEAGAPVEVVADSGAVAGAGDRMGPNR